MKPLVIRLRKGESIGQDEIHSVEASIMNASSQNGQDPEDMDFLTLKENIQITVRNWRERKSEKVGDKKP